MKITTTYLLDYHYDVIESEWQLFLARMDMHGVEEEEEAVDIHCMGNTHKDAENTSGDDVAREFEVHWQGCRILCR